MYFEWASFRNEIYLFSPSLRSSANKYSLFSTALYKILTSESDQFNEHSSEK